MVKRRNEKVAHLVLESTFTAEKRQCDGEKRSFGCWKSSRLDCTIMFAYGVNECSQMVVGTCMSGGRMRAFPKKKSPLQWTWPDLTLVFFAKVSHLSPRRTNSSLMAKQRDSLCVFCLLLFFTKGLLIGKEFGKPFVLMKGEIRTHISANIGKQCHILCFGGERNANESDGKHYGRL